MSLPDTIFIFVLALIIFGPKKLPEIGRQLGKLVGEFRRASNEFKFQIEEELRQAELADRQTIGTPNKELETSSSTPSSAASPTDSTGSPDLLYPEETLPVGQYPNIDNLDPYELNDLNRELAESKAGEEKKGDETVAESAPPSPSITPAVGTEPRTTVPHTASGPGPIALGETDQSEMAGSPETSSGPADVNPSPKERATQLPNHESADPYSAPAVADITHG